MTAIRSGVFWPAATIPSVAATLRPLLRSIHEALYMAAVDATAPSCDVEKIVALDAVIREAELCGAETELNLAVEVALYEHVDGVYGVTHAAHPEYADMVASTGVGYAWWTDAPPPSDIDPSVWAARGQRWIELSGDPENPTVGSVIVRADSTVLPDLWAPPIQPS